jgi:hypothetical protein
MGTLERSLAFCYKLIIPEAADQMVVDHADGLHEGVANRGADELEAVVFQRFAHGMRLR